MKHIVLFGAMIIFLSFASHSLAFEYVKVAGLPKENIFLYAKTYKNRGAYKGFKLKINNETFIFPNWVSTTDPAYCPIMTSRDIDNDGKNELDIILSYKHKPIRHILKFTRGKLVEV